MCRSGICWLNPEHTVARVLLINKILVADVDNHPAAVEAKVDGAVAVAPGAVDYVVASLVNGRAELLANLCYEVFAHVREGGTSVEQDRHGESVARRVDNALLAGLGHADRGHVNPISARYC